jgi:hypothetical protein
LKLKARAGFSFKGTPDWGAERSSFLAAGNARREAEDVEAQRLGRQALFPGGRTAGDALSADVAFRKLQQARQELDPAYQREQELRDASTFMDPRMVQRRQMQQQEGITEQKRLRELALSLGLDPKALFLGELEHKRKMELARVAAEGRYSGGLFGKLGASAGIPRGTADAGELTEAEIIQAAQQENWSEEELQSVLRQFRQGGG